MVNDVVHFNLPAYEGDGAKGSLETEVLWESLLGRKGTAVLVLNVLGKEHNTICRWMCVCVCVLCFLGWPRIS